MSATLVYQAYGVPDAFEQTLFSLLSLRRHEAHNTPIHVAIYTDQPEWFQRYFKEDQPAELVETPTNQFKVWRGDIDFVHRVKIEVLKNAAARFSSSIFYCDSDTYFLDDPHRLFSDVSDSCSLMHIKEAELGKPKDQLTKKIHKFVKCQSFNLPGEKVQMGATTEMWNAGVIGLSKKNTAFFDDILNLTDQMHRIYPKHVTEQLAVSYILQTRTHLKPSNHLIYHYWNQKPEYQLSIQRFLGDYPTWRHALEAYPEFQFPSPPQKPVSLLKHTFHKLFGSARQV